ncbi:MAG: HVO_0476 family zinc finger protein [Halobacteriota archaeon]
MIDDMDREIDVECPSCSPTTEIPHEIVSDRGKRIIRCVKCSTTRQVEQSRNASLVKLRVVVSFHDKSYLRSFEVGAGEVLEVGDEIVAENESAEAVRITAIESSGGLRSAQAPAGRIKTIWAQKIDRVIVKVAVHRGRTTQSYDVPVEGDKKYVVGDQERHGEISHIKIKKGPVLERKGQAAQAKDIQRIYVKAKKRRTSA